MNINEIVSGMGLELSQDQLDTLCMAVEEGYVTREEHRQALESQRFEAMLDAGITAAGARSAKAVRAMLDMESLRANPDRETVDRALAALKESDGYLFTGLPSLVLRTGSENPHPRTDAMDAFRRAAMG